MGDWIAFWDSEHSIYVNARHRDVHYRRIAQDIRAHLPAGAAVLDYGCGEALHADIVAETAGRLILCEAAPMVRAALGRRFGNNPKIEVRAPEEIAALPSGSIDVVVLHSVAQYLSPKELDELLVLFRRLLGADGVFILGDVIPPHVSALGDAAALHSFCRAQWISRRRAGRARAHIRLRLLAPALEPRSHPLRRSGGDGEADPRGILGAARAGEYRSQPRPHDVSGASRVTCGAPPCPRSPITVATRGNGSGRMNAEAPAPPRLTRP